MRDEMKVGDQAFFYHKVVKREPAIVGTVKWFRKLTRIILPGIPRVNTSMRKALQKTRDG